MTRTPNHLPYNAYYLPVLFLTIAGIVDTFYLSLSHYRNYTDLSYASFCAISKAINCDTVAQSPWSIFLGVPVAFWGLIGYTSFALFLLPLRKHQPAYMALWSILVFLGAIYSLGAVFFGYISAIKIHSYCILCIASYGISFSLFYLSWLIHRRFSTTSLINDFGATLRSRKNVKWMATLIIYHLTFSTIAAFFLPHYWELKPPPVASDIPTGITEDGAPWIGAKTPVVTVTEFSDYMCFQCKKMHFFLRRIVEKFPDRVRLVHRHFPMDHVYNPLVKDTFHSGSGKMSIIAIFAQANRKFWETSDMLYEIAQQKQDFNTRIIAAAVGVDKQQLVGALINKYYRLRLKHDIALGIDLGITGTPGFVIGNDVYMGNIPPHILKDIF